MRISDWSSDVCSSDLRGGSKKLLATSLQNCSVEPSKCPPLTPVAPIHRWATSCSSVNDHAVLASRSLITTKGAMGSASAKPRNASMSRSEEHTSELQSLMRISYVVLCLKKKQIT